jgi:hypothetical protein
MTTRRGPWPFLLVILAAAPARALEAGALDRRVEAIADEASRRLSELERVAAWAASPRLPAAAAEDVRRGAYAYCMGSPATLARLAGKSVPYYLCRAVAADDVRACDEMLPSSRIPVALKQSDCAVAWAHAHLGKSVIMDTPEVEGFCRTSVDLGPEFPADLRPMLCRYVRKDLRAVCENLQRDRTMFRDVQQCVDNYELYWGSKSEKACGPPRDNWENNLCLANVRYRKVLAKKDASLCGDSLLCRALTGNAAACEAFLDGLKDEDCRGQGALPAAGRDAPPLLAEVGRALAGTARPLTSSEQAAADRLDAMMLGREPLDERRAVADVLLLRRGALDDLLDQGRALCAVSKPPEACGARRALLEELAARASNVGR